MTPMVEAILKEFREEVPTTRRVLERIPPDKLGWKPHPKSRSLGELAVHVARLPGMAGMIAQSDEFSVTGAAPAPVSTVQAILADFEDNVRVAEAALSSMTEQTALGTWRLTFQGKELLRKPRVAALRTNVLNHWYHHRGQLSVYLRLLDVPVPPIYGPTADENPFV